ncbi:MAG TPA: FAD-binding protein [Saprospiraceae bacterium]|nr:FAD-binding protein [Saprospiraceae bacterium]
MPLKSHDVIVIGCGPAGCAAAATCTKAGLNVLIITDQTKPDPSPLLVPAPLESIHPGVSSLLVKISAAGADYDATMALYSGINAGGTYTPLGEDGNGIWQGMHINRDIFNARLVTLVNYLELSVMFGVSVEDFIISKEQEAVSKEKMQGAGGREQGIKNDINRVIGIKTRFIDLYATYIIDASGKKAIAGKKLKFKQRFYSPPLICWTGVSKIDASFPFDTNAAHFIPGKNGWTWLAPQPPDYCTWTRLSVKGEKDLSPPTELKDYPVVGKINFANMRWRLFRPVSSEGIVLCGDAAGILDPAAGQGIFNALISGIKAANTVVKCITGANLAAFLLAHYDDWFVQQFEEKVKQLRLYYEEQGITVFDREQGAGSRDKSKD